MSTALWPPLAADELAKEEKNALARELAWLLESLQETLLSLKSGLEECARLLAPEKGPSTLVLSSLRSESIKGFVTRIGTRVVKGDINLQFSLAASTRGNHHVKLSVSNAPEAPTLALPPLVAVRSLINDALDVIDVSTWTGDFKNADFIAGQLRLLFDHVQEARKTLKGDSDAQKLWWEAPLNEKTFNPPCPQNISFHLLIKDASLVLQARLLESTHTPTHADSLTGLGLRDRLASALGSNKGQTHEEIGDVFEFRGEQVHVREVHHVESQDPNLLAVMAKLSGLEHSVAMSRRALETVMGHDEAMS